MDGKPNILTVFEREGATLQQRGKHFWTKCLLHIEKTPSCKIDPDRQTFYCFGCHEHGDVIALVRKLYSFTFKKALNYLGISPERQSPETRKQIETAQIKKRLMAAFKNWEREYLNEICILLRGIKKVMAGGFKDMNEAEQYSNLFHAFPVLDYHHDFFCGRDDAQKYELFMEAKNATR